MALHYEVDSVDGLDDGLKSLYKQADNGKFRLDVSGVDDGKELKAALEKERQASRDAKKLAKQYEDKFDGIDPDVVRSIMAKFASDEEAGLIAKGEIDKVLDLRTQRMKDAHEKELGKFKGDLEAREARLSKLEQRAFLGELASHATKAGIHAGAVEDAMFFAREQFALDDDGKLVAKDGSLDSQGKPLTMEAWFTEMKSKKPHWFPAPSGGGGGGGNNSGSNGGKSITREQFDKLPPYEQMKRVKEGFTVTD